MSSRGTSSSFFGKRYQLFRRQAAMSLIHGLGQRIGNHRTNPHHPGGLLDAELHRDGVGGLEADAADVAFARRYGFSVITWMALGP